MQILTLFHDFSLRFTLRNYIGTVGLNPYSRKHFEVETPLDFWTFAGALTEEL